MNVWSIVRYQVNSLVSIHNITATQNLNLKLDIGSYEKH